MKFKEWLDIAEMRMKDQWRDFRNQYPNLPDYPARQIYNNRVAPALSKVKQRQQDAKLSTVDMPAPQTEDPTKQWQHTTVPFSPQPHTQTPVNNSPNNVMADSNYLKNVVWTKKPVVVSVTPLSFDEDTLHLFNLWRFGFAPKDHIVRNDADRFATQLSLLQNQPEGSNEPIVMIQEGDKYKLLEGFHRTMLHLLAPHDDSKGAPPDQIEMMKTAKGRPDFSRWMPVKIRAYVGVRPSTNNLPQQPSQPSFTHSYINQMREE